MPRFAAVEREHLADLLAKTPPDAPPLCAGWDVHDLAAHLVVRERRPDAAPGAVLGALERWTERVRRGYAARPHAELVETFRNGPPRWSPLRIPRVHEASNLVEHFVHAEDVRRAQPGWTPRTLPAAYEQALWEWVARAGRAFYRRSPVGVTLAVPAGPRAQVRQGPDGVTVLGRPDELVLHAFGRTGVARVEVEGSASAVHAFAGSAPGS